eukprot:6348119-Amphidinium_carterae.1
MSLREAAALEKCVSDATGTSKSVPVLTVVIFSKDRPFQLLNSLSTLVKHVTGVVLDVFALYCASSAAFADSYEVVKASRRIHCTVLF